ncbi:MAG: hypothetical protein CVV64_07755 [Candidatus Wallbacteria bacterium HGW-Wallbacteria-1]|jgi:outer membrane protein assembly factor BamB/polyferredoxin|uniref:4Fe-4S ferredoxin-type domain-containing protein n=1 Tax=Candidatus Wallbacteria bacterium HGW-Wallbacteria-1 TaxID=2013854 RepID=A0A2N1PR05_9BACT|nr:MAG: hypothetical protein CVV64_07755 [Candidatus Wallbacteria bacterium HGW-Wallbacteria-1]
METGLSVFMPRFKVIELPMIPIEGSAGDVTPMIVMLMLFGAALACLKLEKTKTARARSIIMTLSSLFLVIMVHRTMCFLRGWIFGLQLIGRNNVLAFYYLSMFVALTLFGLVSGGLFCGWMCPVGFIQEITGRSMEKFRKILGRFTGARTILFFDLLISLGALSIFGWMVWKAGPYTSTSVMVSENTSTFLVLILMLLLPAMVLKPSLRKKMVNLRYWALGFRFLVLIMGIWATNPGCTIFESEAEASSMITLAAVVAASLIVTRAYCRYICPFGAYLGLLGKNAAIRIGPDNGNAYPSDPKRNCSNCMGCEGICPNGALSPEGVDNGLCLLCGRCLRACGNIVIADNSITDSKNSSNIEVNELTTAATHETEKAEKTVNSTGILILLILFLTSGCGNTGRTADTSAATHGDWGSFTIAPDLSAEVFSPSMENRDRGRRLSSYETWTQFRADPARSGQSNVKVNPKAISLLWSFALSDHTFSYSPGMRVWSANAVVSPSSETKESSRKMNAKILVGAYDRKLYCLDAITGKLIWKFTTGGDISASPALGTPTDKMVYVASRDRTLYALNLIDGHVIWSWTAMDWSYTASPAEFTSPITFQWKGRTLVSITYYINDTSPVNNIQSGETAILDGATGKLLWRRKVGTTPLGEPCLGQSEKLKSPILIIPDTSGSLGVMDAVRGTGLWRFMADYFIHSPAVWNSETGNIFFGTRFGVVSCLNGFDGKRAMSFRAGHYVDSAPLVYNLSGDPGRRVMTFGCHDRSIYCVNTDTGKKIWKIATGNQVLSSPAGVSLENGRTGVLISSTDDHLYLLDGDDGAILWKFRHGPLIWPYVRRGDTQFSSPSAAMAGKRALIIMPAYDGVIYAFAAN